MAGLLNRAREEAVATVPNDGSEEPTPIQRAPEEGAEQPDIQEVGEELEEGFSPEEQQNFDQTLQQASALIFGDDETSQDIVSLLQQGTAEGGDPAQTLSEAARLVIASIEKNTPQGIMENAVIPVGIEIVGELGDFANESGIFPVDDAMQEKAATLMLSGLMSDFGTSEDEIIQGMVDGGVTEDQFAEGISGLEALNG